MYSIMFTIHINNNRNDNQNYKTLFMFEYYLNTNLITFLLNMIIGYLHFSENALHPFLKTC